MKLTRQLLKEMVQQVVRQNKKSLLLNESYQPDPSHATSYAEIMEVLHGMGASSIGIMSGQNPMAKVDQTANNAQLHQSLIRDVTNQGLRYIEVGGVFGGLPEDSLVIIDPSMDQMAELNRKYKQWGFVYGPAEGGQLPSFVMMKMDVDANDQHTDNPPTIDAGPVEEVIMHPRTIPIKDDYTFDVSSKQKFLIPLYGVPDSIKNTPATPVGSSPDMEV